MKNKCAIHTTYSYKKVTRAIPSGSSSALRCCRSASPLRSLSHASARLPPGGITFTVAGLRLTSSNVLLYGSPFRRPIISLPLYRGPPTLFINIITRPYDIINIINLYTTTTYPPHGIIHLSTTRHYPPLQLIQLIHHYDCNHTTVTTLL